MYDEVDDAVDKDGSNNSGSGSSKLGIDGTAKAIIEAIHIYDSLKK